jgi:hypothetical protein
VARRPETQLKRNRELALKARRELKQAKKDARASARRASTDEAAAESREAE